MSASLSIAGRLKRRLGLKDDRRAKRTPQHAKAWIRLGGGFAARQCELIDLSSTGARLRVQAPRDVPDEFTLLPSRYSADGRLCGVKWRRGVHIGVGFSR